jgi:hypothetical protein
MDPSLGVSGDGSESTLMRVLTGILEDSVQSLQRIEKAVNESTKIANRMLEKIDLLDKKIESGFVAVVKKAIPSLEHKFIEKIDSIGAFGEATDILPEIINKLQQSMQILTIQNLLNELGEIPGSKKKEKPKKEVPKKEEPKKKAQAKTTTAPSPQEEVAEIQKAAKEKEKEEGEDHLLRPSSFFGS